MSTDERMPMGLKRILEHVRGAAADPAKLFVTKSEAGSQGIPANDELAVASEPVATSGELAADVEPIPADDREVPPIANVEAPMAETGDSPLSEQQVTVAQVSESSSELPTVITASADLPENEGLSEGDRGWRQYHESVDEMGITTGGGLLLRVLEPNDPTLSDYSKNGRTKRGYLIVDSSSSNIPDIDSLPTLGEEPLKIPGTDVQLSRTPQPDGSFLVRVDDGGNHDALTLKEGDELLVDLSSRL